MYTMVLKQYFIIYLKHKSKLRLFKNKLHHVDFGIYTKLI